MFAGGAGAAPSADGVYGGFDIAAAEGGGGEPEPLFAGGGGGGGAGDDGDDKKPRHKRAGAGLGLSGGKLVLAPAFACLGLVTLFLLLMSPPAGRAPVFVFACCAYGALFSYWLYASVLAHDDGTAAMREVADPIREGAEGFLRVQYRAIARNALGVFCLILVSYHLRPAPPAARGPGGARGVQALGNGALGAVTALAFVAGAACSAGAGYLSMWVASMTNIRVAGAARRSYAEALVVCFRGGAFSAVLSISLCVFGVAALYYVLGALFGGDADELGERASGRVAPTSVPMLMVGYGFGASFVALFMQLGGGIYTKAADVGADLVGKVEQSIPEDDPRNPAVIADLVGDMVGDCVGSSADVFESVSAEIIGAMILGGTLAAEARLDDDAARGYVLFPLVAHALEIVACSLGMLRVQKASVGGAENPMDPLKRGYAVAFALALAGFAAICRLLLHTPRAPAAWLHFFACAIVGIVNGYVFIVSTQYYTDYAYKPVRDIAEASTTGHGTNIITGTAIGMRSTAIPTLTVSCAVLASYHLGRTTGLGAAGGHSAGLFGTAVATMGMLSTAVYVLSMNNFGPIADNAGGIAEMSRQPEHVRDTTDQLDAAGNVTKAITKGYSIGSASLACFLLFGAFMDEFSEFAGRPFRRVDIAVPEVFVGGLVGTMVVFYFVGLSVAAVGKTAGEVVVEVRRQLRERPEILEFKARPDYRTCVALVTRAALDEMVFPGLLCVGAPVAVGLAFRAVGALTGRPLLGAEVLAGYLMFGTVAGIMMALFLDNVGGAWDNAKKFIELGNFGGKNSEAHKAAVTGDTVGDPFKDTAGPSLHVMIKLLSTTVLVLGPLFVQRAAAT